ncbi:MAG TPA: hypothetical protein VGK11_12030 [Actinomycetota bacterium]
MHRRTLPTGQQLADRGRIQPVGLPSPVALLLPHSSHLPRVEQPHDQLGAITQVTGQRLVVVPGCLHAHHHDTGIQPGPGDQDEALELGQPSPVGTQPDTVEDHIPKQVGRDHKPGRFGHIDTDQQHPPRINAAHQLQERPRPLATDVGTVHHRPAPSCRLLSVVEGSLAGRASFMNAGISAA